MMAMTGGQIDHLRIVLEVDVEIVSGLLSYCARPSKAEQIQYIMLPEGGNFPKGQFPTRPDMPIPSIPAWPHT